MKSLINNYIKPFIKEESGQSFIEYALIAALLIIVVIAVLRVLGNKMKDKFDQIQQAL